MKLTRLNHGRVTIPVEIRKKYGLSSDGMVRIMETERGILLVPITVEKIDRLRGSLKGLGLTEALLAERIADREMEDR